jgi:hypothetical protein
MMALDGYSTLAPPDEDTFSARLLTTQGQFHDFAMRAALGMALASIAGLAMGARDGVLAMAVHAAGVPFTLLAVSLLGLPSLYVVLSLFDTPLDLRVLLAAAASTLSATGLVLAGLAPTIMLFGITSAGPDGAAVTSGAALAVGGFIGLSQMRHAIAHSFEEVSMAKRTTAAGVLTLFGVFAVTLAVRLASALLPVLVGDHT